MSKLLLILIVMVPFMLAACGGGAPGYRTPQVRALQDRCSARDYAACAELGHLGRAYRDRRAGASAAPVMLTDGS
mgnify:CR=1 FL=1